MRGSRRRAVNTTRNARPADRPPAVHRGDLVDKALLDEIALLGAVMEAARDHDRRLTDHELDTALDLPREV